MARESEADLALDALMRRDKADGSGGLMVVVMVACPPGELGPPGNEAQGMELSNCPTDPDRDAL